MCFLEKDTIWDKLGLFLKITLAYAWNKDLKTLRKVVRVEGTIRSSPVFERFGLVMSLYTHNKKVLKSVYTKSVKIKKTIFGTQKTQVGTIGWTIVFI